MLYQFTGTDTEVFPTILTAAGVLVAEPGQLIDLPADPNHPRLVAVFPDTAPAADKVITASLVVDPSPEASDDGSDLEPDPSSDAAADASDADPSSLQDDDPTPTTEE